MLSDLIFKIKGENNNKEISDFLNILDCIYKNKEPEIDEFILKNLGIEKRENDLKIYGKNYPLFKMLYYFNEITLFNSEKESIIFLKNNNLNPSKTYLKLDNFEKERLKELILNFAENKVPNMYKTFVKDLIFGNTYYFSKYNMELKEYVSNLNSVYKLKEYDIVKNCILKKELPPKNLILKYKTDLSKSIDLFNKKLNNTRIREFSIDFDGKNFDCQYIYFKQSLWDKIKGWFFGEINGIYYPAIVNISYNNSKIDYLKPFFILNDNEDKINVVAKVPKLLYLKYGLTLNYIKLNGKHTYFGKWNIRNFKKILW
ncbi:hypothetical protein [Methanococcus maripaludis]|uniref:Conserved Hypothetical Archael Protein n=1 Tax=Methanococcus maripaludis (strain DSM 14266 / JCM 13030 / NBRC 101832 / S2 / LL) TaxID=267377 RepID=Q6LYB3_METMP|nr:hypothetical protein [Methanococcus maripaludis]CAF30634.1 Conserved Hypothetical Archael Protein [Methanococcus maripaludis S2]